MRRMWWLFGVTAVIIAGCGSPEPAATNTPSGADTAPGGAAKGPVKGMTGFSATPAGQNADARVGSQGG